MLAAPATTILGTHICRFPQLLTYYIGAGGWALNTIRWCGFDVAIYLSTASSPRRDQAGSSPVRSRWCVSPAAGSNRPRTGPQVGRRHRRHSHKAFSVAHICRAGLGESVQCSARAFSWRRQQATDLARRCRMLRGSDGCLLLPACNLQRPEST